jgi:hypothetical protein
MLPCHKEISLAHTAPMFADDLTSFFILNIDSQSIQLLSMGLRHVYLHEISFSLYDALLGSFEIN